MFLSGKTDYDVELTCRFNTDQLKVASFLLNMPVTPELTQKKYVDETS